jgi:hypothetical protein
MPRAKIVSYTASGQVLIQSEFSEQLEELTRKYIAEFQPRGITELSIVRDLAAAECRIEYTQGLQNQPGIADNEKVLASLTRYQKSSRSMFKRSLRLLKQIQKKRALEDALKPQLVKPKITGGC